MGIDASTEERALRRAAARCARQRAARSGSRRCAWCGSAAARCARVRVRVPTLHVHEMRWTLTLRTEDGIERAWRGAVHGGPARRIDARAAGRAAARLPRSHDRAARRDGERRTRDAAADRRAGAVHAARGAAAAASARSASRRTSTPCAARGTGAPATSATSRRSPSGRAQVGRRVRRREPAARAAQRGLRREPVQPDHAAVPQPAVPRGGRTCPSSRTTRGRASGSRRRSSRRSWPSCARARMLDYGRVMALRAPVLESLHRTFVARERAARRARGRAYAQFVEREDPQLTQFATFMAIAEREGPDARQWPEPLRDANGAGGGARCARELAERVDFHRWLQFELDRQLGCVATDATRAGLALGVYQDLAVGSAPSGSDVWANPGLFVPGATVGAPPDMYSDEGQNWGLPAINPHVLRETRLRLLGPAAARRLPARGRAAPRPRARTVPDVLGAARRVGARGDVREVVRARPVRHPRAGERAPRRARRRRGSGHRAAARCRRCSRGGACSAPRCSCSSATSHTGASARARDVSAARAGDGGHARPAAARRVAASSATSSLRSEVGDLTDPEQQRGDARRRARRPRGR